MSPWPATARILATVALATVSTLPVLGDDLYVPVGARVRVRLAAAGHGRPLIGTVLNSDDRQLTLDLGKGGGTLVLPRESVAKLELSHGKRSRMRGALIGALASVALTAVLAATDRPTCTGPCLNLDYTSAYLTIGAGAAAAGGLLGAVIPPGERWETVHRGAQITLRF